MKISYNWLKEVLPVDLPVEEAAAILTNTGLEVEGVEEFVSIQGGLDGLVIGEVVEKWKHPNADRLSVTKVNIGEDEPLQIVCGAPNVAEGQKVVVATVGTQLYPSEGDPFKIKKGKIRGEVSMGMICAEDEIGMGASHDGIMVLDADAKPGTPAGDFFDIYRDHTIEIGLTPNRTDAMSHIGVARDLAVALKHAGDLKEKDCPAMSIPAPQVTPTNEKPVSIRIEAPEACVRYAGAVVKDVKVGPSPAWLQNKLKAIDIAPINNIVDITNFVLHEFGHPLHAFDLKKITGNEVVVRLAKQDELFVTLDDKERKLQSEDLVICNSTDPMCIAGVFGGAESGIKNETTDIFLESAVFDPVFVRKTSRHHLLHTDAAYRFERGVDPETTLPALRRAIALIEEIAGGKLSSGLLDEYPTPVSRTEIQVSVERTHRLIGKKIPVETIKAILDDLDFEIVGHNGDTLQLKAPLYRRDVEREADVVEEILRIYGYNNVEIPSRLHSTLSYIPKPNPEQTNHRVADMLVARGFQEIMSNSLTRLAYGSMVEGRDLQEDTAIKIKNPLSSDLGQMRQSLLFQGLEAISRNVNHKHSDLRFFEFGRTYHRFENGLKENPFLALWITGKERPENWNHTQTESDFYTLRGAVDSVFQRFGISSEVSESTAKQAFYSDGLSFHLKKQTLGSAGMVAPKVLREMDIEQPVYYAELHWDALVELQGRSQMTFREPEKFPAVRRDLSLLLNKSIKFKEIEEIAQQNERNILRSVGLFDVYEGKNLPEGKKSYAVSFILQDEKSTLTDKRIDKTMQRIQSALEKELGAELRS